MSNKLFTDPYKIRGPRGAPGAKGDRGPYGLPGPQGPTGGLIPAPIPTSSGLTFIDLYKAYGYTGSFTVPSDKTVMYITALGAGGGGGGGYNVNASIYSAGGGGGGGSGIVFYEVAGVGGTTFNFIVGKGGIGGLNGGGNGSNGGDSSITFAVAGGATLIAPGGQGGNGGGAPSGGTSGGGVGGTGGGNVYPYPDPVLQTGGGPAQNGNGTNGYAVVPIAIGGGGGGGGNTNGTTTIYGGNGGPCLYQVQTPVPNIANGIGGASFLGVSAPGGNLLTPAFGAGGSGGNYTGVSVTGINGGDGVIYVYY